MTIHTYSTALAWDGSTGQGYRDYSRAHTASAAPATDTLALSADANFRGDGERHNPEQLLVIAASSCQLLAFLGVAARAGVDVLSYTDEAEGRMDDRQSPVRIGEIALRPTIVVAAGTDRHEVQRLVKLAHESCYIAHTLRCEVTVAATVVERPHRGGQLVNQG